MSANRKRWQNDARITPTTSRDEDHYSRVFDIQPNERVLDLGAGKSPYAPENTVRLDYRYRKNTPKVGTNVAGLFQELPFRDESFDRVVASWSIYVARDRWQIMSEALRVLRVGGEFQDFPVKETRRSDAFVQSNEGRIRVRTIPETTGQYVVAATVDTLEGTLAGIANTNVFGVVSAIGVDALGAVMGGMWAREKLRPNTCLTVTKDTSLIDPAQREAVAWAIDSAFRH